MNQEPDTLLTIKKWILRRFPAKFEIFQKIDVNGKNASEVYRWLRYHSTKRIDQDICDKIAWNFEKFLVDKNGNVFNNYTYKEQPLSFEMDIKELLGAYDEELKTSLYKSNKISSESTLKETLLAKN